MSKQRKCYGICKPQPILLAINVQAVCDRDAFITNIVAHWPGSTHDSCIFENSNIADKLRDGALDGILLGDSGYAC